MKRSAVFSKCGLYRYSLSRTWGKGERRIAFIGINPSFADGDRDDHTIKKCIGFAKKLGADGIVMVNLFALVSTEREILHTHPDPVGPDNDAHILAALDACDVAVACWGSFSDLRGRDHHVLAQINNPMCLGITQDGYPKHPSRPPYSTELQPYAYH